MNLNFVKQQTPLKVDGFDFINFHLEQYQEYFIPIKGRYSSDKLDPLYSKYSNCLSLTYMSINTWNVFLKLIPDHCGKLRTSSTYECPFTGYKHTSILPVCILSNDPLKYILHYSDSDGTRPPWYAEMACDASWNYKEEIFKVERYTHNVSKSFLGPGYTQMFYPNDGHASLDLIGIELDNGDTVLFLINKWYNK